MKKILFSAILLLLYLFSNAQELNCRIRINYQQVKTTNQQIFQSMQRDLIEFMNTTRWTNYVFSNIERIDCDFLITITDYNGIDDFKATLQVSSTRPVYNTTLSSPMVNIMDKNFRFKYVENQSLVFNENTYTDELTSTLAFYAYIILGYDFDSFSKLGGTEFFEKAQKIVENAQISENKDAWKAIGSVKENNRYYIAKYLNSPNYKDFREALYLYHRLGLDMMTQDMTTGRKNVLMALEKIQKIYQRQPDSYIIRTFIEAKRQEIKGIFSEAPMQEAKRAAQTMKIIDPTHASDYDKMGSVMPKP